MSICSVNRNEERKSAPDESLDVSCSSRAQQKDKTEDDPVSAKVRIPPYVSGIRKSRTDGSTSRSQREGKRGTNPTTGKGARNLERRKTCRKASQKTSRMRSHRSSSSDSETEDSDFGAWKKSTPSSDGKTPHRTPSSFPKKNVGYRKSRAGKPTGSKDGETSSRTHSSHTP